MYRNLNVESLGVSGRQSELIELALTYKFRGFDIDMSGMTRQAQLRGTDHAARYVRSSGIRIGCFELPVRWRGNEEDFKKDLDRLVEVAELAPVLGALRCHTAVMPASDERSFQENFEFHRERLGAVAEVLGRHDVHLGLGFLAPAHHRKDLVHQFIITPSDLLTLTKMIGAPNVGVCIDLWHWHLAGGTLDQVRELSPESIVGVRVADVAADASVETVTEKERLLPGATGVVPVAEALAILDEAGYEGPVSAYPNSKAMRGLTRDQIVQQTASALSRVWPGSATAAEADEGADAEEGEASSDAEQNGQQQEEPAAAAGGGADQSSRG
jgi:sugar phosphate isomerase/epimerase